VEFVVQAPQNNHLPSRAANPQMNVNYPDEAARDFNEDDT
jgi:hypothetical protein